MDAQNENGLLGIVPSILVENSTKHDGDGL